MPGESLSHQSAIDASPSESEPLLSRRSLRRGLDDDFTPEDIDPTGLEDAEQSKDSGSRRQMGLVSAIFMIFNRIIGTGIFSTPSVILRSSGSVGVALVMWVVGALVAAAGTAVYIELGTGLPRSGGEKIYLEYIYRRPKYLVACGYASYAIFIGWTSANAIAFGEYVINALGYPLNQWNARLIGIGCVTFSLIMHGVFMKWGLRLQNGLGFFNLFILLGIAFAGLFHWVGVPGFELQDGVEVPNNFEWDMMWAGTTTDPNAIVTGLFSVTWGYIGYHNANYVLSEVRNPVRTIKLAAPLALGSVTFVYLFINFAYFAVVSKNDILGSGRIVAALFFRNLFGPSAGKFISIVIAMAALGNVMATLFAYGRVIQDLGREGILPWPKTFASNKPFGAPLVALSVQALTASAAIIASPPGDAYLFMVNFSSYPLVIFNISIAFGLLLLYTPGYRSFDWRPPVRIPKAVACFFLLANLFLLLVPLIPPAPGFEVYEHLPYWLHAIAAISISLIGVGYWYGSFIWLPRRGGYELERKWSKDEDGVWQGNFVVRR
ncbi:hypothetical protein JAAARDRAFT_152940 [Jaapia argillacea MUCL 33604]|uniref:Amino acid permease/ SLC12A domain-containing protein n=1 Tax=Jaapia argillacea MUCL 33604 TaxID=933084 RepID=A0A067PZW8_9AGAM|nr:hypothetical protein JAAARDRAFT_152940 [Jaapia argillacea MUCL 33604]